MTKKRQQRKNTNPAAKPKRRESGLAKRVESLEGALKVHLANCNLAIDIDDVVEQEARSLLAKLELHEQSNETAFQVSNAAIDEHRQELDQLTADAKARDNELEMANACIGSHGDRLTKLESMHTGLFKNYAELDAEVSRLKANLEALRHHTAPDPAPLPDHVAKVAQETFGHGAVFENRVSGSRLRLLKVWAGRTVTDEHGWPVYWMFEDINVGKLIPCPARAHRPTLTNIFGENGTWHPVRP